MMRDSHEFHFERYPTPAEMAALMRHARRMRTEAVDCYLRRFRQWVAGRVAGRRSTVDRASVQGC